jgi:hypothetical protein
MVCAGFVGMIGLSNSVNADIVGDWVEEIIKDTPTTVLGVAIGDVDADGINEIVIGMYDTTNEIRMYKKENGLWREEIIFDTPVGVRNVVIADADNDGLNEIVVSLSLTTNEVRLYEYADGIWVEENITDTPVDVYSLAVGDCDNDGLNEVVIGLANTTNELRAYQKSGTWNEDIIADPPNRVNCIAIGDADNDGNNSVVIGIGGNKPTFPFPVYIANETRTYKWNVTFWEEENITDTGNLDVNSVFVGDADEDGQNEVCFTVMNTFVVSESVQTYEKKGGNWTLEYWIPVSAGSVAWIGGVSDTDNDGNNELLVVESQFMGFGAAKIIVWEKISGIVYGDIIVNNLPNGPKVVIGDCDSNGVNEVVIGLGSTTQEVRVYSNDRGTIRFTSHNDGDYISGIEEIEVMVTSNFVTAVRFYLDDVLIFTDTVYPYQFILDTTSLTEDAIYALKAEGVRGDNPPLTTTINLGVNNIIQTGDYISVSTLKNSYAPDQGVSVLIGIKSPPTFDSLNLMVSYSDPSSNILYTINQSYPYNTQYIIILPLSSDAVLGTYSISAAAFGFNNNSMIWNAINSTTFDVSGMSLQDQLAALNVTDLVSAIQYLNQTLPPQISDLALQLSGANDSILSLISSSESGILSELNNVNSSLYSEIQNLLSSITNDIIGLNSSLSDELAILLNNLTTDNTDLRTWLDTVLLAMDQNLTTTNQTLHTQLNDLENYIIGFNNSLQYDVGNILSDLQTHDIDSGQDHSDIITKLDNLLAGGIGAGGIDEIKAMLLNLAENLSVHNQSIAEDVIEVVNDIGDFEDGSSGRLEEINGTLDDLTKLQDILDDIDVLKQDLQTAEDQIQNSIDEIPKEKEEGEDGFGITEGLLIIVLVLLLINILITLMGRKGKPSVSQEIEEEKIEPETSQIEDESEESEEEI